MTAARRPGPRPHHLQFGVLTPLEPRLAKKLVDPLTNLIQTTPAMSLLYEAISTVTLGELAHVPLVKLSVQKLRAFIESPDQNRTRRLRRASAHLPVSPRVHARNADAATVKYLGLLALNRFLEEYPKLVAEHNDVILKCVDDNDVSIRLRALDLLVGRVRGRKTRSWGGCGLVLTGRRAAWCAGCGHQVTKKNLPDIVRKLLSQLEDTHPLSSDSQYRTDMVARIITLCSQDSYKFVTDFEWYLSVLVVRGRSRDLSPRWVSGPCCWTVLMDCVDGRGRSGLLTRAALTLARRTGAVQGRGRAARTPAGVAAPGRCHPRQGRAPLRRQAHGTNMHAREFGRVG